jgi:hypothetical protein
MVLAETGDATEAAAWFQRAINTARRQQAESLELRVATSFARLWCERGRHAKGTAARPRSRAGSPTVRYR